MRLMFTLLLSLIAVRSLAQARPFGKYAFEKGGYAIVGLRSDAKTDMFTGALGEFYTDDIAVLNRFKSTWVFTNRSPDQHCGYHYSIQVTRNGTILEDFLINLDCKVIATGKGYYYFNPNKLMDLAASLKKPEVRKFAFDSSRQGSHFIDSIKRDKNLLLTFEPFWTKYEGTFTFHHPAKHANPATLEKKLRAELQRKYPGQPFVLAYDRPGTDGPVYRVIANRAFYDRFKAYPRSGWKRYEPEVVTAWRPSQPTHP